MSAVAIASGLAGFAAAFALFGCALEFAPSPDRLRRVEASAVGLRAADLFLFGALLCFMLLFCSAASQLFKRLFADETVSIFAYAPAYQLALLACVFVYKKFASSHFEFGFFVDSFTLKKAAKYFVCMLACVIAVSLAINAAVFIITGELPQKQEIIELFKRTQNKFAFAAALASFTVLAPIVEELLFRGVFYRCVKGVFVEKLDPQTAARASAFLVSALFAALHSNAFAAVPLFVVALFLTSLYERTGSIVAPILCHSAFNILNVVLIVITAQ